MASSQEILRRAQKIRLLAMDVDGVLTDGSIILLKSGEEVKFWNVKDRIGFVMLRRSSAKFYTAWITGRESDEVQTRAREVGVDALYLSCVDKGRALKEAAGQYGVTLEQTLYIGDDLIDLPALRLAGLSVCPSDAHKVVRQRCHWVTRAAGGRGAFREAVDLVLRAQGLWKGVFEQLAGSG